MEIRLEGIGVSPGISIGPALIFDVDQCEAPCYTVSNHTEELDRLNQAIEVTRKDLTALYQRTAKELGKSHADIFKAHLVLLDDVAILEEVTDRLQKESYNVEYLLQDMAQRYARIMQEAEDARFRERTADLLDVVDRVMRHLLDAERPNLQELSTPSIVVAHELSPSDTATMNLDAVLGVAMDSGSMTSHTAILARALEIPAVMGLEKLNQHIENAILMVVDGGAGRVILNPSTETLAKYQQRKAHQEKRREQLQHVAVAGPCCTQDGVEIKIMANIELPIEIQHNLKTHAEGIGLYRTEYLFLNRNSTPSEEEQYQSYAQVVTALNPCPVTLRTIDIGGDKFVSHLQISKEENPQLGWRAVRFCLARPDIFKAQLRAMLRSSVHGNISIMFPMISGVEELRNVKAVLEEVKQELRTEGVPFDEGVKVGSMIEVPSAVALADLLALECDFFSIGTNDLIQYSLAVDRVNEKIAHLYDPAHPAVLRMISTVANAARARGIPCGICGEMAGDPLYTEVLLGLGVSSLSMSAVNLPVIRAEIAQTHMDDAHELGRQVLRLGTCSEIKALLRERFEKKGAMDAYLSTVNSPPSNPQGA